jgi:hypothetical protein
MTSKLYSPSELAPMLTGDTWHILAGDERALKDLPRGRWIAGTIPYFMGEGGGAFSQTMVQATALPNDIADVRVQRYDASSIEQVYHDAPNNGLSFILLPGGSATHMAFALRAPHFPQFATRPLIGWIAGVFLDELGKVTPKVIDGRTGERFDDGALVLHVGLAKGRVAELGIVNIFEQGDGPTLTFDTTGFEAKRAIVDGVAVNFVDYVKTHQLDTRLPLVASYGGAMVNTSFQTVDDAAGVVRFYAPVFEGVAYRHARPVGDYVAAFREKVPARQGGLAFSCNCILNYLYSGLEGRRTGEFVGPITFGEVAYQLLNQTLAFVRIVEAF